ncbi:MAG: SPOR domain-containing protein [Gammaproteobacteria bacterium]
MPIDYKYRAEDRIARRRKRKSGRKDSISLWKWMLITFLIICFVVFLFYIRAEGNKQVKALPIPQMTQQKKLPAAKDKIAEAKPEPEIPHFDFYTILPEKETVVPDHEIATRTREEQVGAAKKTNYILQAGSFREFKEADRMRAKLALMGIESRIEKAKVGSATWYRIKLGPFTRMSSVSIIRTRLRKNGIDAVVTELGR